MDIDLFGDPIGISQPQPKAKRSNAAKGYAAQPGSGPQGETCRSCQHSVCLAGYSKNYWKCRLLEAHWTKGLGSDIRLKSPACKHWQPLPKPPEEYKSKEQKEKDQKVQALKEAFDHLGVVI